MSSLTMIANKQKKKVKLILHLILELASKLGVSIDKNLFQKINFSKAVKILRKILRKIHHTAIHYSMTKHDENKIL